MKPFVSVIVPVFLEHERDRIALDACVEALLAQTYPRDRYEVILVDNGGLPVPGRAGVILLREPRPGSYAARNTGLAVARGDIYCFTDHDCMPIPEWLELGVRALEAPGATGVVAGGIPMVETCPPEVSPTAYNYMQVIINHPGGFERDRRRAVTANLIVRREVMEKVGRFDPTLFSGGDMEWGKRAQQLGFFANVVHEAKVIHRARPTIASVVKRELRIAGGNQDIRERDLKPGIVMDIINIEVRSRIPEYVKRAWFSPRLKDDRPARLRLAAAVVLVQTLRTAERFRIYLGGTPRRS
jgi:glycosyltransferase involved in cell wall biosynthesis